MDLSGFEGVLAYSEFLEALAIFLVFVLFAWVTRNMFRLYHTRVSALTKTTLDDELLDAVRKPVLFAILVAGVYFSVMSLGLFEPYGPVANATLKMVLIVLSAYAAVNVVDGLVSWYMREVAVKMESTFDDKYLPVFRKIIAVSIYMVALLFILGELGVEITPLIASLGIGGLAVALALQDTLANFFAGAYIVVDKPLRPGDYVEFEGREGYVEEVGWRSTKIKTLPGNIIVVPNSTLAKSTITNYYLPTMEMAFVVPVGVSYDSDLDKVERVTVEVAKQVLKKTPGGVKDFEPFIRYNEFDDYSIKFSVILRVEKFVDKYLVLHEFIKALKKRYDAEGIEIPYPIHTIHMKEQSAK